MLNLRNQRGFSLVEISIVVLIMGLLLGGLMAPLSVQRENARLRDGRDQLDSARTAITGFALVNGYLPCPATAASGGLSASVAGGCSRQHGFVPATTLGLSGLRNPDNLVLDPWGSPLRYSVSVSDADSNGDWDFVTPGEMRGVTMQVLQPDLVVCNSGTGSSATACASAVETLADQAPAVVYSLGNDWSSFSSADQLENVGATTGGGPSGRNYRVAGDDVFVMHGSSKTSGSEFDDLVIWVPASTLFGRLVDAGQLP